MVAVKFKNTQETFDWLEDNVKNWFIYDEDMEHIEIEFESVEDAVFANESLN